MKLDRKAFFRLHSWIGIKLSILFFVVCFSGTMATLSSELDWLFIPECRATPQATQASRNLMAQHIEAAYPEGRIVYWTAMEVPYLCDLVHVMLDGHRTYVFVNPYTGEVQGKANLTFRRFFRDLHYFLFIPFQVGHFTVLFFGFLLLFSLVTALVFYKKWYRKLFDLKMGKGPVVFFRSLHRVVGVWAIPFMFLFSVTGIWYFLERTNTAGIARTANMQAPTLEHPHVDSAAFVHLSTKIDYDQAIGVAQREIPGLVVKTILPPGGLDKPLYLTGTSEEPLVRFRANRVYLHPLTMEVLGVQQAEKIPAVTWLNDIADPLHFGYWGGLLTKVIWFFAGLAISGLVLTGIWISLKRKVRRESQAKKQRMGGWRYVNWGLLGLSTLLMYGYMFTRYRASATTMLVVTVGWAICCFLGWYIFVYQLRKQVEKEKPPAQTSPS
ncbi:MAG: PepSY-associated TM helix domain-containing protein [Bacteroidota bacterium]